MFRQKKFQVLDVRSYDRFYGRVPEPRPNLKRGHIPSAKTLPFGMVVNNKEIVSEEKIRELVSNAGIDLSAPIITSCGTGVTAPVVSLALSTIGKETAVYDGSWTEYGQESLSNPLETN